ncbi:MAG TPA: DinB family protein [Pricia sp.]|nr:DinB family protein [Pricia sp.]
MENQLKYIMANLSESFDGRPWYGISVMEKLDSIDWLKINAKTYGSKSIAVLVRHIINWRIFCLKKLEGDMEYDIEIDGQNDWPEVHIDNQQEWEELKAELRHTQEKLLRKLSEQTDDLLLEKVPGKSYSFGPMLNGIAQHDIYHLGQIAMLKAI